MDLNSARSLINHIDKEIVKLLEKRFNIVMEIGDYKKANGIPVYDEEREKAVLQKCIGYLDDTNYEKAIMDIYTQIMNSSKELEKE